MKVKNKLKKAFTLIELVVVIAVIAILAGVSVAAYFGVTESAKKSNLETKEEQINTLFTTYQLENGSDLSSFSKSELNNYMLGFSNYLLENGLNEDESFKYKVVELINTSKTRSNEDNDSSKLGVIFLIREDNYYKYNIYDVSSSSMINLDDSFIESSIFKSEEEVKNNIITNSGSFISSEDKSSIESSSSLNNVFLPILKEDEEGNKEYIIPYYLYLLDKDNDGINEEYYVPITSTLLDEYNDNEEFKDYELGEVDKSDVLTVYDTRFDITFTGSNEKFDISKVYTFDDNSEPTLKDGYYLVNTINLNYKTRNYDGSNINLDNYETSLISSDQKKVYYFSTLDQFINAYNEDKFSSFGEGTYLFVGDATLDQDFTVPNGWTMVVDFLNTTEDMMDLMDNYSIDSLSGNESTNLEKSNNRRGYGKFESITGNPIGVTQNNINNFTIKNGSSLNFSDKANLRVEGYVGIASGGNSFGTGDYGSITLEGNSSINLSSTSTLKSTGYILGEGAINTSKGSKVYEVFKYYDFRGGQISSGFYSKNVFPLMHYKIDNICANLYLVYGSIYNLISSAYAGLGTDEFNDMSLPFISNEKGLFIGEEGSVIKKSSIKNGNWKLEFLKGNFHDSNMNFEMTTSNIAREINSIEFPFPLSNVEMIVSNDAELKINAVEEIGNKEENSTYVLMPGSTITLEGKLIFDNSSKLILLNSNNNFYKEMVENVTYSVDTKLWETLSNANKGKMLVIKDSGELFLVKNSNLYGDIGSIDSYGVISNESNNNDNFDYTYLSSVKTFSILGLTRYTPEFKTISIPFIEFSSYLTNN